MEPGKRKRTLFIVFRSCDEFESDSVGSSSDNASLEDGSSLSHDLGCQLEVHNRVWRWYLFKGNHQERTAIAEIPGNTDLLAVSWPSDTYFKRQFIAFVSSCVMHVRRLCEIRIFTLRYGVPSVDIGRNSNRDMFLLDE